MLQIERELSPRQNKSAAFAYLDGQRKDLSTGFLVEQTQWSSDVLLFAIHVNGGDVLQNLIIH